MNKLISVIIPMYNTEKYISDCLNSLLKQTYTNFEAIVINDGSTDRCGEIVKEYMKKDSRFKLIEQKNQGASAARNLGIEIARGDYLYFLDSDDFIHEKTFQICMSCFEAQKVDMVTFDAQCVFEDDYLKNNPPEKIIRMSKFYDRSDVSNGNGLMELSTFLKLCLFNNKFRVNLWINMIDMDVIKKNRIRFDNKITYFEDCIFLYFLSKNIKNIKYLPKKLYYRRLTGSSLMTENNTSKKIAENLFYCINLLEDEYHEINHEQKMVNKIFKQMLCAAAKLYRDKSFYEANGIVEIENERWKLFYHCLDKYRQLIEEYEKEYNKAISDIDAILNQN